jgi:hypothetical protein
MFLKPSGSEIAWIAGDAMDPHVNECCPSRESHRVFLHCVHDVPCSNRLRSSFVDPSAITAVFAGRHKPTRDQRGTQNNSSEEKLSNQPFSSCESS